MLVPEIRHTYLEHSEFPSHNRQNRQGKLRRHLAGLTRGTADWQGLPLLLPYLAILQNLVSETCPLSKHIKNQDFINWSWVLYLTRCLFVWSLPSYTSTGRSPHFVTVLQLDIVRVWHYHSVTVLHCDCVIYDSVTVRITIVGWEQEPKPWNVFTTGPGKRTLEAKNKSSNSLAILSYKKGNI